MSRLVELREQYHAEARELHEIFEQAGPDYDLSKVTRVDGDSAAKAAAIRRRNDHLGELRSELEGLEEYQRLQTANAARLSWMGDPTAAGGGLIHPNGKALEGTSGDPDAGKTWGQRFTESAVYADLKGQPNPYLVHEVPGVTLKTVMTLSTGFAQAPVRSDRVVYTAMRRPVVADLIPDDPTSANVIRYMEETTFTNNAAPVAEGAVKPEAALGYTERTQPVELIAVTLPVTNQQLDDVPAIRGIIDNRLTLMIQLTEETQLLTGTGTSPQLLGFLNKSGVQTQAKATDPTPDAVYKAMTKVRYTGFAEPSGAVLHPNDWQDIRLLRTTDGIYIWGSPAEAGPERIWGLPVVITTAMTENTALLGDFQLYSHISRLMGLRIDVSTEHSDFFARNQVLIRAEERLSLEIYRASAFCTVTGI